MGAVVSRVFAYFTYAFLGFIVCSALWYVILDLETSGLLILAAIYCFGGLVVSRFELEILRLQQTSHGENISADHDNNEGC